MKRPAMPEKITSGNAELRRIEVAWAPNLFGIIDRDRKRLREFLPWVDHVLTIGDEEKSLCALREKWDSGQGYDYGIFDRESGEYIGNAGLHTISFEHERAEIGYWVAGPFEGKGYVTDGVRGLVDAAFKAGFYRLEIRCSSFNERSSRVPERLGFQLEGRLREDCVEEGRRSDTLIFGKLRGDASN